MNLRKRKPVHPIHLYSLGYAGTKRTPMTWFQCPTCGYQTLGSSFEEDPGTCAGRWTGPHEEVPMVVAPAREAHAGTVEALDGRADLISRALRPK
jgi:hypothetical protein